MLNKGGERGHPCLVSDLKGNTCSFCLLSIMVAVGLSYMIFIMFRHIPSIPTLLKVFFFIINGCWIISKALPACIDIIIWFLSFILLLWCIIFIDLWMSYQPYTPEINSTWSWCMIFLMYCCIRLANTMLRFSIYVPEW